MKRLLALLCVVAGLALVPTPAYAAARVTVDNGTGGTSADPTYLTTLRLRGTGFQSIQGGHGGIYVFFGTVRDGWRPSQGGVTGEDYAYVPDSEARDNQGYQRYIAFPGSDTASAAQATMAADGSWSTTINVPGARFETVDRDGQVTTIDCREVTCGVITVGAHGVKNARNESFTPVRFAGAPSAASSPSARPSVSAPATESSAVPSDPPSAAPSSAAADAKARPGKQNEAVPVAGAVDPDTAVVGRVLSFTGTGFTAGEQVTASFDHGRAAVGPLAAGASGEVAGVLQLPGDVRSGTHVLRLTGAASSAVADVAFPIKADPEAVVVPVAAEESSLPPWSRWVFLGGAALVLLLVVLRTARSLRSRGPAHA